MALKATTCPTRQPGLPKRSAPRVLSEIPQAERNRAARCFYGRLRSGGDAEEGGGLNSVGRPAWGRLCGHIRPGLACLCRQMHDCRSFGRSRLDSRSNNSCTERWPQRHSGF